MTGFVIALIVAPQLARLSNGIPVVVETQPGTSTVSIDIQIDASMLGATELTELELLASALFGETENRSLQTMRALAWQIGGALRADVTQDALRIHLRTSKTHLQPAAAFLSDMLRNPTFEENALRRAYGLLVRRDTLLAEAPSTFAFRTFAYASGIGPGAAMPLKKEQAESAFARLILPERVVISVAGDATSDEVVRVLSGTLGGWSRKERFPPSRVRSIGNPKPNDLKLFCVRIAGPTPRDAEFAAWMTVVASLGMGKGSRMNQLFRERVGWSYLTGIRVYPRANETIALVTAFHYGADAIPNSDAILSKLEESEFVRAKQTLLGKLEVGASDEPDRLLPFGQGYDSQAQRAYWNGWWQMRTNGKVNHRQFLEKIRSLTFDEVRAQAEKTLSKASILQQ